MLADLPFTIASLHAAYGAGVSATEIVAECYRRIATVDDPGIFIELFDQADVLEAAEALQAFDPAAKPLWGVPFVIKDNIDAAGKPTTAACPAFAFTADRDAFVVARLKEAGALLIGKTNLDQFATGLVGVRTPYPVPRNALDPAIVPGGSSSGSAVAVSHGLVTFGLGTDTAGSGRVPAALNNIVGLKPTLGALSASGVVPACRTLDTISIFALSVDDAYAVFAAACAFDAVDAYARRFPLAPLGPAAQALKIGVPSKESISFFGDAWQEAAFDAARSMIEGQGGAIVELDFGPLYAIAQMLYDGAWVAERYTVVEALLKRDPDALHPVTRAVIARAEGFSAADAFRDMYCLADLRRKAEPLLAGVDMLCVPTIPTFISLDDLEADPIGPNSRLGTYTNFVNLMDLCAIAVPTGLRGDGRPASVTLIAGAGEDARIAALAARLHGAAGGTMGATAWPVPTPTECATDAAPGEIALLVAGAHMSGLPLNGELTRLGARFLRAARTAGNYRLYALAGGPPFRPGLVRSEDGAGINTEIWALPRAAWGDFIAGIPAPLGIGTVRLEDGADVKGFICEASALPGARDITRFGGWREFLEAGAAAAG
ncbi:allophanate hydrolase [Hoeflea sp. BAL378]|uniref:allophanate hydrolase n=1 Tax=Hoeflea sp. BAL378 TaxID=1547437 RepID=UPI00051372EB|nr:allophanate hydrolase [Hoeflea sp. BAL378]KGF67777.1 allophanate hydrolase [Hoeflea sp. BAL378]